MTDITPRKYLELLTLRLRNNLTAPNQLKPSACSTELVRTILLLLYLNNGKFFSKKIKLMIPMKFL